MEDKLLIDGLFARDERSVARLEEKYSGYCYTVAYALCAAARTRRSASATPCLVRGTPFRRTDRKI